MPKACLIRFVASAFALGALSLLLSVRPASADGVTLTLNTTNLTVTEGDSITLDYTVTNNTGSTITLGEGAGAGYSSGDNEGGLAPSLNASPCFSGDLTSGSSCDFSVTFFSTDSSTGETDADFGEYAVNVNITYGCPTNCITVDASTPLLTVADPGAVVPTPEPSSLLLLGVGLLGLGSFVRRCGVS